MCHIYVKPLSGLFKKYTVFSGKKNIYHCWEWANKYLQATNETVEEHQQLKSINVIVESESFTCFIFKDYSRKKWLRKCYKDYFIYKFKPLFNKTAYVEHPYKLAIFNHPIQDIHPSKNTSTSFLTITSTNVDTKPKTFSRLVSALLLDLRKILRPHLVPVPNY